MTARSPNPVPRMRSAIAAAALLAVAGVSVDAPAQDRPAQTADDVPPPAAKSGPPGPSYLEPLYATETTSVLGKNVIGPNGEKLGLITDVVVDRDGRPRAAIIDFGGFLGVGSRKVAIDWNLLTFATEKRDRSVVLALDRREIQAAPEYKADAESTEMVGPPLVGPSSGGDAGK
jgi:PRC-barrel domain